MGHIFHENFKNGLISHPHKVSLVDIGYFFRKNWCNQLGNEHSRENAVVVGQPVTGIGRRARVTIFRTCSFHIWFHFCSACTPSDAIALSRKVLLLKKCISTERLQEQAVGEAVLTLKECSRILSYMVPNYTLSQAHFTKN